MYIELCFRERVEGELTGAIEAVGDEITALQGSQSDIGTPHTTHHTHSFSMWKSGPE